MEKRFEIKSQCIGPAALGVGGQSGTGASNGPAATATKGERLVEGTESRLLNRVVRCPNEVWGVEPDQRHADLIVQELALTGVNGLTTPGENEPRPQEGEVDEELSPTDTTRYRAIAAHATYLVADRPDLMYALKEMCRGMARPTRRYWNKLKR